MNQPFFPRAFLFLISIVLAIFAVDKTASRAAPTPMEVGIAARDITPELPIWLAGYASRNRPADRIDARLLVEAIAFKNPGGERFVLVSLDNCEVSREFTAPIVSELEEKQRLKRGEVMIVSSHTHSAPVLEGSLGTMYSLNQQDQDRVHRYSESLRHHIGEVVLAALHDCQPAEFERGAGQARFAMNRRIYKEDRVDFGENPEGPVDWDVSVLKIKTPGGRIRAILFGYACHGTSISGEGFYSVSGDYMAYAREQIQSVYPGASALYLTGMGADSNPAPRGELLDAKRHGLELAGAVVGVLGKPMSPVHGPFRLAYAELDLPLEDPPSRLQLEKDAQNKDVHIAKRARAYMEMMDAGKPLPTSVKLPLAAVTFAQGLTWAAIGGEVVVDYDRRLKRLLRAEHPWLIGYAYEIPCYIPSMRILKEGGYEAQSSLIYYGVYGPFRGRIEDMIVNKMQELAAANRAK